MTLKEVRLMSRTLRFQKFVTEHRVEWKRSVRVEVVVVVVVIYW